MSALIPTPDDAVSGLLQAVETLQDKLNAVRLAQAQGDEDGFWTALESLDTALTELPKTAALAHATIDGLRAAISNLKTDAAQAYHEGYKDGAAAMLDGGYLDGETDYGEDIDAPMWIEITGDYGDE